MQRKIFKNAQKIQKLSKKILIFSADVGLQKEDIKAYMEFAKEVKEAGTPLTKTVFDPRFDAHFFLSMWQVETNRFALIIMNISDIKKLEQELARKNEDLTKKMADLDNALDVKNRFLATMSHGEISSKFQMIPFPFRVLDQIFWMKFQILYFLRQNAVKSWLKMSEIMIEISKNLSYLKFCRNKNTFVGLDGLTELF